MDFAAAANDTATATMTETTMEGGWLLARVVCTSVWNVMEREIEFLDPVMFDQEWRGMPQNLASSPPPSAVRQSVDNGRKAQ